jgi:transglutaminase-like putative cysteine protease
MDHMDKRGMPLMTQTDAREQETYLRPTEFIDSDNPVVVAFVREAADAGSPQQQAVRIFYAVRDRIKYDPYRIDLARNKMRASVILQNGYGYCVAKAMLLTAAARVLGIPARLRFADIRNFLTPERLRAVMKTDLFTWHGYTEMLLDDCWVKATPAFNLAMCEKLDIVPVEFDGIHDATFAEFDKKGRRHIEYVRDHGHFPDLPYTLIVEHFRKDYPIFFTKEKDDFLADLEREAMIKQGKMA